MSKDPKVELQTQYYSLLNGNVDVDGVIPVYDGVPGKDAEYPYIAIGEYTQVDDSDKSSFGEDLTVTLVIADRFINSSVSRRRLFSIVSKVKEIIRARPNPFDLASFNVITSVVDNQNTFKQLTDTYLYVYEQLRFRHLIEQVA